MSMNEDREQKMMTRIDQLTQQVLSMQAAVAAATAMASQQPPSISSLEPTKDRAKLNAPQPFDGRVTNNVLTWLISVESYLLGCNTPRDRWPLVASTYLTASALDWYHSYVLSTNGALVWESFKAALIARFRPLDSNRLGRAQLMELKMHSSDRGKGILQYVNRFLQLVNQVSDITESEKFTYFNQGLTPELKKLLIPLTHINNINDAISMVVRYEMLDPEQSNNSGAWNRNGGTARRYFHSNNQAPTSTVWSGQGKLASSSTSSVAPMELGSLNITSSEIGTEESETDAEQLHAMRTERLSPEQVKEHMRQGLCFNCHKQGHRSRQCPLKGAARK
jgi:Retrotransposon gag protein